MRVNLGALWAGAMLWAAVGSTGCSVLDWEDIEEAAEDTPAVVCGSRWEVSGTVQAGETVIDYGGGRVSVGATHKLDADPEEDGCLGRLELTVALAQGQCPLKLVFMGKNGTWGGLMEARLTADSACPGFLDAVEGTYTSPAGFAPWSPEGLSWQVIEHGVTSLCQGDVRLGFPGRSLRLYRSSPSAAELTLDLSRLSLSGGLGSRGEASARCFESGACGPGWHDGGDGWCVEASRCSPGYRRSLAGDCVR